MAVSTIVYVCLTCFRSLNKFLSLANRSTDDEQKMVKRRANPSKHLGKRLQLGCLCCFSLKWEYKGVSWFFDSFVITWISDFRSSAGWVLLLGTLLYLTRELVKVVLRRGKILNLPGSDLFVSHTVVFLIDIVFWVLYVVFDRDNDLHRLLFKPNGLPDGAKLAYYAKGQVLCCI